MSTDDVALNKVAIIERGVARTREEYAGDDANLFANPTKQDSIILNVQRACEASIDLGMHLVRVARLGVPQDSRDAFDLLAKAGRLDADMAVRMKQMVGFRNIAVHDYQAINLAIVRAIVTTRLDDILAFARWALAQT